MLLSCLLHILNSFLISQGRKAGVEKLAKLATNIYKIKFLENGEPKAKNSPYAQFESLTKKDFSKEFLKNIFDRVQHIGLLIDRNGKLLTVVRTGWLNKEGADFMKRYKKRWFLLADNTLYYYKNPGVIITFRQSHIAKL